MVQKRWAAVSQRLVLRSVDLSKSEKGPKEFVECCDAEKELIFFLAHELRLTLVDGDIENFNKSQDFFDHCLPRFKNLDVLKLVSGSLDTFLNIDKVFEPHKTTIKTLILSNCDATIDGLVTFVNHFTGLKHLALMDVKITQSGSTRLQSEQLKSLQKLTIGGSLFPERLSNQDAFLNALSHGWKHITILGLDISMHIPSFIDMATEVEVLDLQYWFGMYRDRSTILSQGC